ncbi:GNAT family N-acetyltransferase [Paenibacillus dendritiformis]|uniref:GNAT family N-acetyltransferase n=1 Tax=Paenibacillus dendritiformis TaxID=130049 RepID=UPI00143CFB25|nr:GNAT family N-acetyltransferase [Paenibacillus dendritiformis]NKI24036.1 GNAT family N-acetyltransferase [Paenibacillus dendritiformis]NRG00767.1 GNAT family N-acetyltransferase [Paenibacillus dendritiformis]
MNAIHPSEKMMQAIERSEIDYMTDRMNAIREREGNPEGVEVEQFGHAVCFYSKTMPWPSFNTVKGLRSSDIGHIDDMIRFYRERDRKPQFEVVPGLADQQVLRSLAERGLYPSGSHTSLYAQPPAAIREPAQGAVRIEEIGASGFDTYAMIHCRGTGLPDDGIPHVAANNRVLHQRPGWSFYMAYDEERPAAVGVMHVKGDIASFTFAATLPEYRRRGLQLSLLRSRLAEAARRDCSLAVGQCAFLSGSHRNMERAGMRIGYVRSTWTEL